MIGKFVGNISKWARAYLFKHSYIVSIIFIEH